MKIKPNMDKISTNTAIVFFIYEFDDEINRSFNKYWKKHSQIL